MTKLFLKKAARGKNSLVLGLSHNVCTCKYTHENDTTVTAYDETLPGPARVVYVRVRMYLCVRVCVCVRVC